jgi:hypothetical protein
MVLLGGAPAEPDVEHPAHTPAVISSKASIVAAHRIFIGSLPILAAD